MKKTIKIIAALLFSIIIVVASSPTSANAISVDPSSLTLYMGDTAYVSMTNANPNIESPYTFSCSSSNTSVATVTSNTGYVKAIRPGTATITVKSSAGNKAYCTVTVKAYYPVPGYAYGSHGLNCTCSTHGGSHNGADIPTSGNRPVVRASQSGTVTIESTCPNDYNKTAPSYNCSCGKCGGKGNCIRIDGNGVSTRYMHLSKISVTNGKTVKAGDIIGYVGTTGRSSGTHLHFELKFDGTIANPKTYVKQ